MKPQVGLISLLFWKTIKYFFLSSFHNIFKVSSKLLFIIINFSFTSEIKSLTLSSVILFLLLPSNLILFNSKVMISILFVESLRNGLKFSNKLVK
jgi:hypothetical protein